MLRRRNPKEAAHNSKKAGGRLHNRRRWQQNLPTDIRVALADGVVVVAWWEKVGLMVWCAIVILLIAQVMAWPWGWTTLVITIVGSWVLGLHEHLLSLAGVGWVSALPILTIHEQTLSEPPMALVLGCTPAALVALVMAVVARRRRASSCRPTADSLLAGNDVWLLSPLWWLPVWWWCGVAGQTRASVLLLGWCLYASFCWPCSSLTGVVSLYYLSALTWGVWWCLWWYPWYFVGVATFLSAVGGVVVSVWLQPTNHQQNTHTHTRGSCRLCV